MVTNLSQSEEINLLGSANGWGWPGALRDIFKPRGVNLLVARNAHEFVDVVEHKRIHAAIIDVDESHGSGLTTVRLLKMAFPLMPCIALSESPRENLLEAALKLNVFSVINKPVEMELLRDQLNRLFTKRYKIDIFAK